MGTDIHAVFQAKDKTTGKWEDIPHKYDEGRHYALFAWLADVRNGYGFAGVPTHQRIAPIHAQRGLPKHFEVDENIHPIKSFDVMAEWRKEYRTPGEPPEIWMGDHSHSWLTSTEILDAAGEIGRTLRTGIITIEEFKKWDGTSSPDGWSGGVSGPGISVAESPSEVTPRTTHVRIEWFTSLANEFKEFIDEIKRLHTEYGEVRMVFGFDS